MDRLLNRRDYTLTPQSCICIEHFDDKYIVHHSNRQRLNYSLAPIPTIHPSAIPKSQKILPKKPRKLPAKRIYQEDELPRFRAKNKIETLQDIALFFNSCDEYKGLKIDTQDSHVTAYCVELESGIISVKECIYVDQSFHVQLSYDGIPLPLPEYIRQSPFYKVRSLNMLTNLPNYCRSFKSKDFEIDVIRELIRLAYYSPKGRPKYSSNAT